MMPTWRYLFVQPSSSRRPAVVRRPENVQASASSRPGFRQDFSLVKLLLTTLQKVRHEKEMSRNLESIEDLDYSKKL
jgi:hypothetical protein